MVQMIQLTRGQEETLARITTALEQIAENTRLIAANTTKIAENEDFDYAADTPKGG